MRNSLYQIEKFDKSLHLKMFVIAIFDAIISQFYFDALPFEFKFSISVAVLPVYYYFDRTLNPFKTALYVGIIGLGFRTFTQANLFGSFSAAFLGDFPFIYFDLCYGLLFYFLFYKFEKKSLSNFAIIAVFADWFGNTIEATFRYGVLFVAESNSTMIFLLVALIRVIISLSIIVFFKQYTSLIRKNEHEIRYRQLVVLTSELKSEAYFMQKNMAYIEFVMSDAYRLYSDLDDIPVEESKKIALKIATDIHEIKKNYSRVVHGLGNLTDGEIDYSSIKTSELVRILKYSINSYLNSIGSHIKFITSVHTSTVVESHYLLMSVLRNLVNNAIEELLKHNPSGTVKLKFQENNDYYVFTVSDDGNGILSEDLDFIFEAGFSTKFDESGDICRGVGLALVNDIVTNKLGGFINVESKRMTGTEFFVYIQKSKLGG